MVEIIAEAGVNHCGSVVLAHAMIEMAVHAGADVVKFQTFSPEKLLRSNDSEYSYLSELALPRYAFIELAKHCEEVSIEFMSTPGDMDSLKFLVNDVGVSRIKIGSDDLTYEPLIRAAYESHLPVILSTGMATTSEIKKALPTTISMVDDTLTLLHCVSSYPCSDNNANLKAMLAMKEEFGCPVGYSDHTVGTTACLAAAALGATIIEKHFWADTFYPVPDKAVSITDKELLEMVREVRRIEKMLGTGVKMPCREELANCNRFRKGPDGLRGLA